MLTKAAIRDLKSFRKSGQLSIIKKTDRLIQELKEHPKIGTGQPSKAKGSIINHIQRGDFFVKTFIGTKFKPSQFFVLY